MAADHLLMSLNASQRDAVSSQADTLAILAGPGSGKTHTLTSRTAWLLQQGLQPWNIIVATFTVKAAREMKERIGKLIGNGLESKLILGTFHSIARRYLARYGHLIGIRKDFGIADSADSLAIIKRIVKRNNLMIDPKVARSRISSIKAKGPEQHGRTPEKAKKSVDAQEFEVVHAEYQSALERSNLLDYDDLLVRCVELLRHHPDCVSNIEAVLIDEFQDTNLVQFDLMRLFAAYRKRITIVGDPDQSIYGFRAAETKNYKRMIRQYPDTVTIPLEENYRSSGAILLTSLNVIEQDSSRIAKSLLPTHNVGTRPVFRNLATAQKEADWIISEIQRCMGLTGNLLDLNDFAILLRSAALSRVIESALGRAGIAYRMVGGLRFYDRVEVKTILDYLRVINQPDNNDALARIINTPSRRIGDTTIKALLEEAETSRLTLWVLILGAVQGKRSIKTKLPKAVAQNLSVFVNIILTAQKKVNDSAVQQNPIVKVIQFVVEKTSYEKWLEDHHGDAHKARWDNVQELITQASDFQSLISNGYEDESLPQIDGLEQEDASDTLSRFLANVALASEVKKEQDDESNTPQVTISTIHAAKGLEWPVVFIPAAYQGSIPHSRAEDTDEERRLLYVAMTRAKALLYISWPAKNSLGEETTTSPFLSPTTLRPLLDQKGPSLGSRTVQSICQILQRSLPSLESISRSSACLERTEDTLFPLEPKDDKDRESKWNQGSEKSHFTMGQQAPKRRRTDMNELRSGPSSVYSNIPNTTMDMASTFTSNVGFISAGSHLQVLAEQSPDQALDEAKPGSGRVSTKKNDTAKKRKCAPDNQATLLGFLGKPEAPKPIKPAPIDCELVDRNFNTQLHRRRNSGGLSNHMRPVAQPRNEEDAFLNTHRPVANVTLSRPNNIRIEGDRKDDYVFLSSSPPRAKHDVPQVEPEVVPPPGLTAKPAIMSLVRPAKTLHTTSMSIAQGSNPSKKTLGVKRSMNGWSSRTTQPFIPPTMKRRS